MSLTTGMNKTISLLQKDDYSTIKQADITRLLGKTLTTKESSANIMPMVMNYEKYKFPDMSTTQISKYLTGKIRNSINRENIKDFFLSSYDSSDYDSSSKTVDKKSDKKSGKKSGSDSELNSLLDKILTGDSSKKDPFKGKTGSTLSGEKVGSGSKSMDSFDFEGFFNEGSEIYKENKSVIDKFKKIMSPDNMNSGKWFTAIAGMEIPELKVLQTVVNKSPLKFSDNDSDNLEKLLSRDNDKMNSISMSDGFTLLAKLLVNPDKIGTMLSTKASQFTSDAQTMASDFVTKLTGVGLVKADEDTKGSLSDLIQQRRDTEDKSEKRKKDLDMLKGVDYTAPKDRKSIHDILKPPEIKGFKQSTWYDDLFGFLRDVISPDFSSSSGSTDKEKAIGHLKSVDPTAYKLYEDAMKTYEYTKKKLVLNKGSDIDLSIHKDVLQSTFDYSRQLLTKASSMRELSSSTIEKLYDISGSLEDIMNGKQSMSYQELNNYINMFVDSIPNDVISKESSESFRDTLSKLTSKFSGDSDLINVDNIMKKITSDGGDDDDDGNPEEGKHDGKQETSDDIKDTPDEYPEDPDPEDPDDPDPEDPKNPVIKEKSLDGHTSSVTHESNNTASLRPRLAYGGTDQIFERDDREVNNANLFIETMGLETAGYGNGSDNTLFKAQLQHEKMRYQNCYTLPPPERPLNPYTSPMPISSNFTKLAQPIFISQYAPTFVEFNKVSRNPYQFGQYKMSPVMPETVYPVVEQRNNTRDYPDMADLETGGLEQRVSINNYIENLRFTR
jgi:hypothetical protein